MVSGRQEPQAETLCQEYLQVDSLESAQDEDRPKTKKEALSPSPGAAGGQNGIDNEEITASADSTASKVPGMPYGV